MPHWAGVHLLLNTKTLVKFSGTFPYWNSWSAQKILALLKNNTTRAILRGIETASKKTSDFRDSTSRRISWSAHSPSPLLQEQQIPRGFAPAGKMGTPESRHLVAKRSFEVCSHSLQINPVDSPLLPPAREDIARPWLSVYDTEFSPSGPIKKKNKKSIFSSIWASCLTELSLKCFVKEYVTKTSFQPTFGLPKKRSRASFMSTSSSFQMQ